MSYAFTKSCTFENSYGQWVGPTVYNSTRALWNQLWHGWWAQRLGVSEIACWFGVLCADSMKWCMSAWYYYSTAPIGIFKNASFSEQVLPVSGFLSMPNLTQFPHMRCHIQGQGFGNKMYISELFTVVGYLHTADYKNRQGTFYAKCISVYVYIMSIFQKL